MGGVGLFWGGGERAVHNAGSRSELRRARGNRGLKGAGEDPEKVTGRMLGAQGKRWSLVNKGDEGITKESKS